MLKRFERRGTKKAFLLFLFFEGAVEIIQGQVWVEDFGWEFGWEFGWGGLVGYVEKIRMKCFVWKDLAEEIWNK